MKILMIFASIILLFLSLSLSLGVKALQERNKIQIPLFHITRENYFKRYSSLDGKVISPPLMAPHKYGGLAFIAEVYFGSPSVRQYLHVDTGSALTWTQCFPSSHSFEDHIYPKYWPEDSNTYQDAECETTSNSSNPKFSYFDSTGICKYEQTYLDGNLLRGRLALEKLTLQMRNGEFEVAYDVYFWCNDQAVGEHYIGTGILGLAAGNFSLVHLDTGTTISHFSEDLYNFIVEEVEGIIGDRLTTVPYSSLLCYKADIPQIPDKIDIGFMFAGEAELYVSLRSLFLPNGYPGTLCLTINKNSEQEKYINIIGAVAMQGYNLGFDLKSNTAYFNKQNCSI